MTGVGRVWRLLSDPPRCIHIGDRESDIFEWLDLFHQGEPFAILDDTSSGVSLKTALVNPCDPFFGRVVLCQGAEGLKSEHLPELLQALLAFHRSVHS